MQDSGGGGDDRDGGGGLWMVGGWGWEKRVVRESGWNLGSIEYLLKTQSNNQLNYNNKQGRGD